MIKKINLFIFLLAIIFSVSVTNVSNAADTDKITVEVDGKPQIFAPDPIIIRGETFIPLRTMMEMFGAKVEWTGNDKPINIIREGLSFSLTINSTYAVLNGQPGKLETPPKLIGDYTMVPLRIIGQTLGCLIVWDDHQRKVLIFTNIEGVVKKPDDSALDKKIKEYFRAQSEFEYSQRLGVNPNYNLPVRTEPYKLPIIDRIKTVNESTNGSTQLAKSDFMVTDGTNDLWLFDTRVPDMPVIQYYDSGRGHLAPDRDVQSIGVLYDGLEMEYVMEAKNLKGKFSDPFIYELRITNNKFKTARGITVGATPEEVIGKYGDGEFISGGERTYKDINGNMAGGAYVAQEYKIGDYFLQFKFDKDYKNVKSITMKRYYNDKFTYTP